MFNETQIISVLREQEAGSPTSGVFRRRRIGAQTIYGCRVKYGGVSVPDAQKLKALESESRWLRKLLAESMLGVSALKSLLRIN